MDFFKRVNPIILRIIPLVVIIIILLVTLATCEGRTPEPEPDPIPVVELEPEPEPEPEPVYEGPFNPLSGLPVEEDISMNRPVAIMLSNIRESLPQIGISQADIIVEALVEGGITRLLAIFQDYSQLETVGGIRSARLYFVDIAQSFDAILVFAGGSPQANAAIRNRGITHADGVAGRFNDIFRRDSNRRQRLGYLHSLVTTGDLLNRWFPEYGFRLEHEEDYEHTMIFDDDVILTDGNEALDFSIYFSTGKSTTFRFDEELGVYHMRQFNRDIVDDRDSSLLAATNVLVLRTSVSNIPGDGQGRLAIETLGSGTGYFIHGGRYVEIEWSRESNSSPFEFTHLDGTPVVFGRGLTYICIIPLARDVVIQ